MLGSILDVKSSICFPCSVSTGSIQRVIIVLVYSVNVCQMDTAVAAAAECTGKAPPWGQKGKRKRRKHFGFLLQFYFYGQQLLASCPQRCEQ